MSNPDEDRETTSVTLPLKVNKSVMFLKQMVATIEDGPFKGTTFCTIIPSGAPVISITKDGKYLTTAWFSLDDIVSGMIEAAVKHVEVPDGS